ncbi:probable L-ascorbate peroxidase 3 isoform X1 [Ananas comosus]|uniref:Probable L-ascorbate peroxidase 3 isoform X1 n=1 Tax=Ananas comosus TaxID=4615 RepID=A0A6P5EVH8_ANACO|nr:probable L-ascorbate peroxidase 3 isoform X1 [Ananas comosus]
MEGPVVDEEYMTEIEKARRDLRALISNDVATAPLMLRLAWDDAGTYDKETNTGGPNGSIRFEEYKHSASYDLKSAIDLLGFAVAMDREESVKKAMELNIEIQSIYRRELVKAQHPKITYADLYQLAGVVAVEATGGPTIDFVPGRKDSAVCANEGLLPDFSKGAQHLRDVFYRMGLSDKDIVALSGGQILERSILNVDGSQNIFLKFDNSYFVKLLKEESAQLLHPLDKALVDDPAFRSYVEQYAKDEDAFFKDYAESHKKLSELGFTPPRIPSRSESETPPPILSTCKSVAKGRKLLVRSAVGVAVAAAVIILITSRKFRKTK